MPGPKDWYDGQGDPFESPKYLQAIEALKSAGDDEEFASRVESAIRTYEDMHASASADYEPPEGAPAEPPAAPAAAPAPAASTENRLAPDYYDSRAPQPAPVSPMQRLAKREPSLSERVYGMLGVDTAPSEESAALGARVQSQANDQLAREAKAYEVGANNSFGFGGEMTGLGAMLSRAMPSWLGGSAPPEGFEDGLQQVGRGFPAPGAAPRPMASDYETAKKREEMYQAEAQELAPGAFALGQGVTETIATAPLSVTGAGEAAAARALGSSSPAVVQAAKPGIGQLAAGAGLQGMAGGALQAAGESESDAPIGSVEHLRDIGGQTATGGLKGGAAGFVAGGALPAIARGAPVTAPAGVVGAAYGAATSDDPSLGGRAKNAALYGLGTAAVARGAAGALPQVARGDTSTRFARAVQGAGDKASELRAGATGVFGAQLKHLAKSKGKAPEVFARELGEDIERLGLHKRPGVLGKLGVPATPGVFAKNAERVQQTSGREVGQALREATEQGVSAPKSAVSGRLRRLARRTPIESDDDATRSRTLQRLADRVDVKKANTLNPEQVFRLKKKWEKAGGFRSDKAATPATATKAETHREAAGAPRNALYKMMREQAYRGTPVNKLGGDQEMGTLQRFERGMQDYGPASTVKTVAGDRVAHELGNNPVPLTGASTGSPWWAVAATGANKVGRDMSASALRAGENVARSAPVALPAQAPVMAGAAAASSTPQPEKTNGSAELPRKIRQIFEITPEGDPPPFGRFTDSLREAFDSGDETQITAAIAAATDDPEFQREYLKLLQ